LISLISESLLLFNRFKIQIINKISQHQWLPVVSSKFYIDTASATLALRVYLRVLTIIFLSCNYSLRLARKDFIILIFSLIAKVHTIPWIANFFLFLWVTTQNTIYWTWNLIGDNLPDTFFLALVFDHLLLN
jgi:hypothetical protein